MTAFRESAFMSDDDPRRVLPTVFCPVLLLQADPAENGLMEDTTDRPGGRPA